jgi:RNA polymerase sigma factor (sigma-70 family)
MNDDIELARQYAVHQSEEAFETLVSRYLGLVHSAALRQVRDPQLAEEISQTVFIILARKAGSLSSKTVLPGWLYKTTRYVSSASLKMRHRRERREQEAQMQTMIREPETNSIWEQLSPSLDEAMAQLPDKDRDAIILRFFQNKSLREVGAAFGMNEYAAQKRVARGLEKLRVFFEKRGISTSPGVISGAMAANSIQTAPAILAKSVTAAAITKGMVSSASTLTLMKGALKIMAWTKAKTAIMVGAIVILTGGSTIIAMKTFLAPITIKDAYVKLYTEPYYGGGVLTDLPWEAPSNDVAVRGDIENFDRLPPDSRDVFDFNDEASSAVYLLPKGYSIILYEDAKFDGQQFRLVGTGKIEKIPDFDKTHPGFDDTASSLHWEGVKEAAWKRPQPPMDLSQLTNSPGFSLMQGAFAYLHQLRIDGKLPGVQKDEQILLMFPRILTNAVTYPIVFDFQGRKENVAGPFPYHYTVTKTSPASGWQLQKAWRTDTNGRTVEEYSVL